MSLYRERQAYTAGITYTSNPNKVYEFATMVNLEGCFTTKVKDVYGARVTVKLVYLKKGITPKATRWSSGGLVTEEQRKQYGIKEESNVSTSKKLSCEEVQSALDIIRKLQRDLSETEGGSCVGAKPSLSVSKEGLLITGGIRSNILPQKVTLRGEIKDLVKFVYEDSAKAQARERLSALEKEAAEIRKLLS